MLPYHSWCGSGVSNGLPFPPAGVTTADFLVPNLVDPTQTSQYLFELRGTFRFTIAQARARSWHTTRLFRLRLGFGAVIVGLNGLLTAAERFMVGKHYLTQFLGGSLDGIHPTNTDTRFCR
jgi:hypothetical protein